jgi:hypothetical protein
MDTNTLIDQFICVVFIVFHFNTLQRVKDANTLQRVKDTNTLQRVKDTNTLQRVKDTDTLQRVKDTNTLTDQFIGNTLGLMHFITNTYECHIIFVKMSYKTVYLKICSFSYFSFCLLRHVRGLHPLAVSTK